jgi:hypothetical protein
MNTTARKEGSLDELWSALSKEGQEFVSKVIRIEKAKLHMGLPRGIHEELIEALRQIVR